MIMQWREVPVLKSGLTFPPEWGGSDPQHVHLEITQVVCVSPEGSGRTKAACSVDWPLGPADIKGSVRKLSADFLGCLAPSSRHPGNHFRAAIRMLFVLVI